MHRRTSHAARVLAVVAAVAALAGCATRRSESSGLSVRTPAYNRPYTVRGRTYTPAPSENYDEVGTASWYGLESGGRTSDGERFTLSGVTAAHRTLPIPSVLEVTNLENGRRLLVRLNDRGPFTDGRLLDLSREAARRLGFLERGSARVRVRYAGPAGSNMLADEAAPSPPPVGAGLRAPVELQAWNVRVGSFGDPARAARAAARLAAAGQARVSAVDAARGGKLYRVTVVPSEGASAEETRLRVVALGYTDARVFGAE